MESIVGALCESYLEQDDEVVPDGGRRLTLVGVFEGCVALWLLGIPAVCNPFSEVRSITVDNVC
jgi:hypothetical protein